MNLTHLPIISLLGGKPLHQDALTFEVFIGSQTKNGDSVPDYILNVWKNHVLALLVNASGGATTYNTNGHWKHSSDHVSSEPVYVIRCHIERAALSAIASKLRQVLVQYGQECEQEAVGFTIDGEFLTIDPSEGY